MKLPLLLLSALVAFTSAHGLIRSITGANNVVMPGLSGTFPFPLPYTT
jgi:hypothetical protein